MATTVSLAYLESVLNSNGGTITLEQLEELYNANDGIARLDGTGKLPESLLPSGAFGAYLGAYQNLTALVEAHPTAEYAQYASVAGNIYYYNAALDTPAWSPVVIGITAYGNLSDNARNGQPEWIIEPDETEPDAGENP